MPRGMGKELAILGAVVVLTAGAAFVAQRLAVKWTPKEDRREDILNVSDDMEKSFAQLIKKLIIHDAAAVNSPVLTAALDTITGRITEAIGTMPYPLDVVVLDAEQVNAAAFPGGLIVLFAPLIRLTDSPEQLASVIAHEAAHVVNRDPLKRMMRQLGVSTVLALMGGGSNVHLENFIKGTIDVTYSRQQEERADSCAFVYLEKAGICPSHFAQFMSKIQHESDSGSKSLQRYFSTHPPIQSRIQAANAVGLAAAVPQVPFALDWNAIKRELPSMFRR